MAFLANRCLVQRLTSVCLLDEKRVAMYGIFRSRLRLIKSDGKEMGIAKIRTEVSKHPELPAVLHFCVRAEGINEQHDQGVEEELGSLNGFCYTPGFLPHDYKGLYFEILILGALTRAMVSAYYAILRMKFQKLLRETSIISLASCFSRTPRLPQTSGARASLASYARGSACICTT